MPQSDPMLPPNHILCDRWISELNLVSHELLLFSPVVPELLLYIHDNMFLIKRHPFQEQKHIEISSVSLES